MSLRIKNNFTPHEYDTMYGHATDTLNKIINNIIGGLAVDTKYNNRKSVNKSINDILLRNEFQIVSIVFLLRFFNELSFFSSLDIISNMDKCLEFEISQYL